LADYRELAVSLQRAEPRVRAACRVALVVHLQRAGTSVRVVCKAPLAAPLEPAAGQLWVGRSEREASLVSVVLGQAAMRAQTRDVRRAGQFAVVSASALWQGSAGPARQRAVRARPAALTAPVVLAAALAEAWADLGAHRATAVANHRTEG